MDMTKPISPDQIAEAKRTAIPDYVFKAVNELLAVKYLGSGAAIIKQQDIIDSILANSPEVLTRGDIFERCYLNFEEAYRAAGWKVTYDKPTYDDNYDAYFKFERK
jgi:hypothetical protein